MTPEDPLVCVEMELTLGEDAVGLRLRQDFPPVAPMATE